MAKLENKMQRFDIDLKWFDLTSQGLFFNTRQFLIWKRLFLVHVGLGFPYEILCEGHYVPGTERGEFARYKGKEIWPQVMHVSEAASVEYFDRVHTDFNRTVKTDYSTKMKVGVWFMVRWFFDSELFEKQPFPFSVIWKPWQKAAQMDMERHQELMDCTCLWLYIRPFLKNEISQEYLDKIDQMWSQGSLRLKTGKVLKKMEGQNITYFKWFGKPRQT